MKYRFILLMLVLGALSLPALAQEAPTTNLTDECVTNYDEDTDYYPDKVEVEDADGFSVEYFNNYKVVTVLIPWTDADEAFQYVLVQCGTPTPEGFDDTPVIQVPVQRVVAMSTSFLPYLDAQGVVDRLIGLDSASYLYVSTPSVLERVGAGELADIGSFEPNVELLIDLESDLIMTQQFAAGPGPYSVMQEVGLPVALNGDVFDTSPLGVAEWGKYISLFFNTEAIANDVYDEVAERYSTLRNSAAAVEERPTVFAASAYQGAWYMPGGDSYLAQLVADAGGGFLWADEPGTSVLIDFEVVLDRAADADFWINLNQTYWESIDDALADDERYSEFTALQIGNAYNNNARRNANDGLDYFESGYANPDLILADLVSIFHPDLLPDHELYFYQALAPADE